MLTAEEIWCQLYSEPNAGSDLASLKTRAEDRGDHFLVNGQKIWTSSGPIADWGILLARTDSKAPKHKGISCSLLNMRQPGVEVRPLKQITGSSLFSEVFMTDARAERRDLIGTLNQGWEIAQTTLGFERGSNSLGRVTRYAIAFSQLVRAAKELRRGGRPLIEDPVVRAKIGKIYADLEVQRYAGLRVLSALDRGESLGAASSITKLSYTEFEKRYYEAALEILGPWGQLVTAREEFEEIDTSSGEPGTWATAFLWSRAGTIYSGSSEIQKNIIGERVLGLPKEVRADRLKAGRCGLRVQPRPAAPEELGARVPRRAHDARRRAPPLGCPARREGGDVEGDGPARLARALAAGGVRRERPRDGRERDPPRGDGPRRLPRPVLPDGARRPGDRGSRQRRAEEALALADRHRRRAGNDRVPRRRSRLAPRRDPDARGDDRGGLGALWSEAVRPVGSRRERLARASEDARRAHAVPRRSRSRRAHARAGADDGSRDPSGERHAGGDARDGRRSPRQARPGGAIVESTPEPPRRGRGGRNARRRPPVPRHGRPLRESARAGRAADRLLSGDPSQVRRDAPGGRELARGRLLCRVGARREGRGPRPRGVGRQGVRRRRRAPCLRRGDPGARRHRVHLGVRSAPLRQAGEGARGDVRRRRLPP